MDCDQVDVEIARRRLAKVRHYFKDEAHPVVVHAKSELEDISRCAHEDGAAARGEYAPAEIRLMVEYVGAINRRLA